MHITTPARDELTAFHAAHPDVENAGGEQLLELPPGLLDKHDALLATAAAERSGPLVIDPATGIREILPKFPGGTADGVRVFTTGRNAQGRYASFDAIRVTVTRRGHWYRSDDVRDGLHNDPVCRGCGHHGHFNYILDYRLCTSPATADDVVTALSGPARHVQPGDRVRLVVSEYPDPVVGTIRRIYRNVINKEVAEIDFPGGRDFLQCLEFLTLAN